MSSTHSNNFYNIMYISIIIRNQRRQGGYSTVDLVYVGTSRSYRLLSEVSKQNAVLCMHTEKKKFFKKEEPFIF